VSPARVGSRNLNGGVTAERVGARWSPFQLPTASRVEARVVDGAGAMWLDRLVFEPDG